MVRLIADDHEPMPVAAWGGAEGVRDINVAAFVLAARQCDACRCSRHYATGEKQHRHHSN
jgi:hypothetical protein